MRLSPDTFYAEDTQGDTEMRCSLSAARNNRGGIYVPPESIFRTIRPTKKPTVCVGGVDVLLFAECVVSIRL